MHHRITFFQLCDPAGAEYLMKLLSNSELIIFDDCRHLVTVDKPEEAATSIIDFLERHSSAVSRL